MKTMMGAYGEWAESLLLETPGALSFLNSNWDDIDQWKEAARDRVRSLIALLRLPSKPDPIIIDTHRFDGLEVEELSWHLPYGPQTRGCLLKPEGVSKPLPAILALHDHGGNKYFGRRKITKTDNHQHALMREHQQVYYGGRAWANEMARRGYVVLVHDIFPFASRRVIASDVPGKVVERLMTSPLAVEELEPEDIMDDASGISYDVGPDEDAAEIRRYNGFAAQHEHIVAKSLFSSGRTWPGMFIAEDLYALDYLCSRDDVQSSKVGCCGLSGGGLRTDYLAGLDDRIACSVSAGFMTTWRDLCRSTCFTHTWMVYIPHLPLLMDFPEILSMRAPLPALVLSTRQDPLFTFSETERAAAILEKVYEKANASSAFEFAAYDGPHKFDIPMQEQAFRWFDRWLT